jgi:ribonuclease HI
MINVNRDIRSSSAYRSSKLDGGVAQSRSQLPGVEISSEANLLCYSQEIKPDFIKYDLKAVQKSIAKKRLRKGKTYRKVKVPSAKFDVHIFCDGSCYPNPGPAASGIVVYKSGKLDGLYHGEYCASGTNNTAELIGVEMALKAVDSELFQGRSIQILSASDYAINSLMKSAPKWDAKGWDTSKVKARKNSALIKRVYRRYLSVEKNVTLSSIKAHNSIEGSDIANRLSTFARMHEIGGVSRFTDIAAMNKKLPSRLKPIFLQSIRATNIKGVEPDD